MSLKNTMSTNRNIDPELSWKIIESYFKGQHLSRCIRHQLESYNDFTTTQIQKTIDMFNPVTIHSEQDFDQDSQKYNLELIINFTNFHIYRPQIHENNGATKIMYPQEARMRNFTYASAMTLDLDIKIVHRCGENLQQCGDGLMICIEHESQQNPTGPQQQAHRPIIGQ